MPRTRTCVEEASVSRTGEPFLEVKGLRTSFYLFEGVVRAVDGVDFTIGRGETLGVIGESGCGKSITARSILRVLPAAGRIEGGTALLYRGGSGDRQCVDLLALDPKGEEIRRIRGKEISMIFQEPMTSFGPLHTIGNQICEAILLHQAGVTKHDARTLAIELLARVGIPMPLRAVDAYPHQLSGGMRQRAMIAMALSCNPSLLIADEPTTALDVTIQAQILLLLKELRQEMGMAIMFITHNLGVIAETADKVAVMYMGKIVEQASITEIFDNPRHPYTQALLRSIPRIDDDSEQRLASIKGSIPDPYSYPSGCCFSERCSEYIEGVCDQAMPAFVEQWPEHSVRCFRYSLTAEGKAAGG
jgi:oligopeptide/dipeptide ABC transporter ATP-binding protein